MLLADRLATACRSGDLLSSQAAFADGASVNRAGLAPGCGTALPLCAAVASKHSDVVRWLLSRGANPNGDEVMGYGAYMSTTVILKLLIDAGGDVNRDSWGRPPLFWAMISQSEDKVRVLLAQPSLDFTVTYVGKTPEQYAREEGKPALADAIAQEVSGTDLPVEGLLS